MTRVTRATVERTCAICERTLLLGERPARYSPNGGGQYVDVCPLCQETAVEHGWIREGAPTTPTVAIEGARKRGSGLLAAIMGTRVRAEEAPIATEPILRRLSDRELAIVEAADHFNASQYRRTVGGISKSLGDPQVSIVVLSGRNLEMVLTVAWDISWYQYRVAPESDNPVRLEDRGHEPSELQATFTDWNAHIDEDGRIVPDLARV
jgi:hypothetical protein